MARVIYEASVFEVGLDPYFLDSQIARWLACRHSPKACIENDPFIPVRVETFEGSIRRIVGILAG